MVEKWIYSIGGRSGTEAQTFTLMMMMTKFNRHLLGSFERHAEGDI
jgi:hypothetical protein